MKFSLFHFCFSCDFQLNVSVQFVWMPLLLQAWINITALLLLNFIKRICSYKFMANSSLQDPATAGEQKAHTVKSCLLFSV